MSDDHLRQAREDGIADQQARVQAFLDLPEAKGLERFAAILAGTELSLDQARLLLRAARCPSRLVRRS